MVGVAGFEPTAPRSQGECSDQAELHPVGKAYDSSTTKAELKHTVLISGEIATLLWMSANLALSVFVYEVRLSDTLFANSIQSDFSSRRYYSYKLKFRVVRASESLKLYGLV